MYALFWAIMDEWKKVPTDAKDNFIGRDETTEQLRVLNVIYDNNIPKNFKKQEIEIIKITKNLKKNDINFRDIILIKNGPNTKIH